MHTADFIRHLEKSIDAAAGSLTMEQPLTDILEWDSVAVLSFMAMVDEHFGIRLSTKEIAACITVADLAGLLGGRITP